ncbi:MAG: type IV pilus modification protein PilV [Pseudomonadota bacterium]
MAHATRQRRCSGWHADGFTLFEVMIALAVLSIGLVGLAALQLGALRANASAAQHMLAVQTAVDMLERMRANPAGVAAGRYDTGPARLPPSGAAGDIARADLAAWRAGLARLPAGSGAITRCGHDCPAAATYGVTVWWNAAGDAAVRDRHCPPRPDSGLRCVRLVLR